jgi:hypothetical protein
MAPRYDGHLLILGIPGLLAVFISLPERPIVGHRGHGIALIA